MKGEVKEAKRHTGNEDTEGNEQPEVKGLALLSGFSGRSKHTDRSQSRILGFGEERFPLDTEYQGLDEPI